MDNTNKTIFLHIGMPKAGSTSIQRFLYNNKEKLKEFGILYPIIQNDDNENDYNIAEYINFRKIDKKVITQGLEYYNQFFKNEVIDKILKNDKSFEYCDKIVFSDELLFYKKSCIDMVDVMKENGFNVKVMICFRSPVEYLASLWQENLKPYLDNFTTPIDKFLLTASANYEVILDFIKKLGKENVIVMPFGKQYWKNGNLIEDFMSALDVENFEEASSAPKKNSSYNRYVCDFSLVLKSFNLTREQLNDVFYDYASTFPDDGEFQLLNKNAPVQISNYIETHSDHEPKVADTIDFEIINKVNEKYSPVISEISGYYGIESFIDKDKYQNYISKFDLEKMIYSHSHLAIIEKAINYHNENLRKKTDNNKPENKNAKNTETQQAEKVSFLENLFSVKNSGDKKVIRIFGLKITLRKGK